MKLPSWKYSQLPFLGRLLPEPILNRQTIQRYAKQWQPQLSHSSLIEKDRACIWHPFTQMQTARPPIPIVRGKGCIFTAKMERRYLDGISSWWVNLHGHAHPYIVEKIKAQADLLEHVIFADFTHAPAVDLASGCFLFFPGAMSKIFYSDNGSTAVEVAIKMALQYWYNQNPNAQNKSDLF